MIMGRAFFPLLRLFEAVDESANASPSQSQAALRGALAQAFEHCQLKIPSHQGAPFFIREIFDVHAALISRRQALDKKPS